MKVLIVEDEERYQTLMADSCGPEDQPTIAGCLDEARDLLRSGFRPDVVILDALFPTGRAQGPHELNPFNADEFIKLLEDELNGSSGQLPDVLLVSGYDRAARRFEQIEKWLEDGSIRDVIPKSAADAGLKFFQAVIRHKLNDLREARRLRDEAASSSDAFNSLKAHGIITRDSSMIPVWLAIVKAARSKSHVFIGGETGTGKGLVAKAIANEIGKKFFPLAHDVTPEMVAGALFGTDRSAYTGAVDKAGLIELAGDGVLFIDEVGSMDKKTQANLLKVLDSPGHYSRLGQDKVVREARCLFVFADNQDLRRLVEEKVFRDDLYWRIMSREISLPPLRERRGDIRLLIEHFTAQALKERSRRPLDSYLGNDVIHLFEDYSWPGNVRQLEDRTKHLINDGEGVIELDAARQILGRQFDEIAGSTISTSGTSAQRRFEMPAAPRAGSKVSATGSSTFRSPAPAIPAEDDDLIVELNVQREASDPTWWHALGQSEGDDATTEERLLRLLRGKLNDPGIELLDVLLKKLGERTSNFPRRVLVLKALLFLVLRTKHSSVVRDLQRILPGTWETAKLAGDALCLWCHDFDLRLLSSVPVVSAIPTEGRKLVVVAAVGQDLHFRIFDGDGNQVVDAQASKLTDRAGQINDLKKQLKYLWPLPEVGPSEKGAIITALTPIIYPGALLVERRQQTGGRKVISYHLGADLLASDLVAETGAS